MNRLLAYRVTLISAHLFCVVSVGSSEYRGLCSTCTREIQSNCISFRTYRKCCLYDGVLGSCLLLQGTRTRSPENSKTIFTGGNVNATSSQSVLCSNNTARDEALLPVSEAKNSRPFSLLGCCSCILIFSAFIPLHV